MSKRSTTRAARSRLRRHHASNVKTWECPSGTVHYAAQWSGVPTWSVRIYDPQPTVRAGTAGGK